MKYSKKIKTTEPQIEYPLGYHVIPKVLILNHTKLKCGVYQFGKRVYELAARSKNVEYFYKDLSNREEYLDIIKSVQPNYIIYNWHWDRMPWLLESDITGNKEAKHYFIYHDGSMMKNYDKYLFFGDLDPKRTDVPEEKRILLPRPLFQYEGDYPVNKVVTIGSFGFAFTHKKFPELVKLINKQFKQAVINIHLTVPFFGDTPGNAIGDIIKDCQKNNINPNIKLNITQDFLNDQELLKILASNDINVFAYSQFSNPGISSAIDYALSVKRPIAISNNMMFRHVMSDDILLEKNSIKSILDRGTNQLEKYYKDWSVDSFTLSMEKLFLSKIPAEATKKVDVLFVNHKVANCGVYQFGKRVYELSATSKKVNYQYIELDSVKGFEKMFREFVQLPKYIVWNWHRGTMSWLTDQMVTMTKAQNYFLFHEEVVRKVYDKYLFFGDYDIGNKKIPKEKSVLLPRPLFNYTGNYPVNKVFTIGSFGFGFWQKGFHNLVSRINKEFSAAVINLHMPHSHFGDPYKEQTPAVIKKCRELNTNPNVKLNITQNFLSNQEILKFLAGNDINAFLYSENGEGLSSATDYALSVRRPIIITDCQMFRHFKNSEITIENCPLIDVYNQGVKPLERFYENWSPQKFVEKIDEVFSN